MRALADAYILAVQPHFGEFLEGLLEDLGLTPTELMALVQRAEKTVYNWRNSETPPRGSLAPLSDALHVPLPILRAVAAGERELPEEYRDRQRWLAARRNGGVKSASGELAEALRRFAHMSRADQAEVVNHLSTIECAAIAAAMK